MLKEAFNNYFGFNRRQRGGLLFLCCLCFLLLIIRICIPYFIPDPIISVKELPLLIDSTHENEIKPETQANIRLRYFDPNKISAQELTTLGISEKTAKTLINFRNKGFVFIKKEDLRKVYGISQKKYAELEPFIVIEQAAPKEDEKKSEEAPKKSKLLSPSKTELNLADSTTLEKLPGIGPSFARRIIKYREILGGFSNSEQLMEVFGFKKETYEKLKEVLYADPSRIHKIDLNRDEFKKINKHPYLSFEQTKEICKRSKTIEITPAVLKDILKNDTLFEKLKPYVKY